MFREKFGRICMEGQMHINIVYCIGIGLGIGSSLFQQIPFLKCALNLI